MLRGVAGVMTHLGMCAGGPAPVAAPIWLSRHDVLRASATGLFYPAVECGEVVAAQAAIGHITDFHGHMLEQIRAPFGGEILYVVRTPPITKGEPVAMVAAAGHAGA